MLKPALILLLVITSCTSTKKSGYANQPTTNYRSTQSSTLHAGDTVVITGFEKVPVYGRSEQGVLSNLEGTWELLSINGNTLSEFGGFDSLLVKKNINRADTLVHTELSNGVTRTETTIERTTGKDKKITPVQSGHYHIPQKPYLSFYGSNETFSGFSGCNKLAGRYKLMGQKNINLQQAALSTRMACIGDFDENLLINSLHEVNGFKIENNQLQFLKGNKVILLFSKKL